MSFVFMSTSLVFPCRWLRSLSAGPGDSGPLPCNRFFQDCVFSASTYRSVWKEIDVFAHFTLFNIYAKSVPIQDEDQPLLSPRPYLVGLDESPSFSAPGAGLS